MRKSIKRRLGLAIAGSRIDRVVNGMQKVRKVPGNGDD